MNIRKQCRRLDEPPKLAVRHQEGAAPAAYDAPVIFIRLDVDDRGRTAIGAGEIFRHQAFLCRTLHMQGGSALQ